MALNECAIVLYLHNRIVGRVKHVTVVKVGYFREIWNSLCNEPNKHWPHYYRRQAYTTHSISELYLPVPRQLM